MTREEKNQIIDELSEKFVATPYFYIASTAGLNVAEANQFRGLCYQRGVEYKVFKNTLISKALAKTGTDYSSLDAEVLTGMSGIIFATENAKIPAKLIKDFRKEAGKNKIAFKAASIEGGIYIGEDQLVALENIKSKNEMIGEVIGLLQSPAKNVISALLSGEKKLAGIVKTLSERPE
jgi:large subunit ribosomal protein L10